MRSFQTKINNRRKTYLSLSSQIESQLREAYDRRYQEKKVTQTSLAEKLGINRSAVHRRLTGRINMTIETIADMVWALGYRIKVSIYDPCADQDGARFPEQTVLDRPDATLHQSRERKLSGYPQESPAPVQSKPSFAGESIA